MEAMKAEKRKMEFMKNFYTRIIYKMKQNTVNQKTLFVNTVKGKNTLDLKRCMELIIKNNVYIVFSGYPEKSKFFTAHVQENSLLNIRKFIYIRLMSRREGI